MKERISGFLDNWIKPVILFCIIAGMFSISELLKIHVIQNICFYFLLFGFLILIVSTIFQFARKGFLTGMLSLVVFITACLAFFYYSWTIFWKIQAEPDRFADNLQIPQNVNIEFPGNDLTTINYTGFVQNDSIDFQVCNSSQPGLYKFALGIGKIENGTIYLKAFEISKNYPLSATRLRERSSIRVLNPSDSIRIFSSATDFTIYEGDWGKPYGARFEVWFRPDDNGKERKIIEKNYIIEGWQR
jgi:hypothetical protein